MITDSKENPYFRAPIEFESPPDDLNPEEAKKEIERLREAIEHHDYLYYVEAEPVISDKAYDQLFRRLQTLEKSFPAFASDLSPTRRVGVTPVDEHKRIEHLAPMLSLDAILEPEELEEFDDFIRRNLDGEDPEYAVEPKFDGLSLELVYRGGEFDYAATRGDGEVGEDISENIKTIPSVPLHLRGDDYPEVMSIRAEVHMTKSGFQELNRERIEKGKDPFANPRNAAAGTVRQLDPQKVAERPLDIFFYDILHASENPFDAHTEAFHKLPEWGFKTDEHSKLCGKLEEIEAFHRNLLDERDALDYEIDGVVIKIDQLRLREKLGVRSRSPRWAVAWKFPAKKEITRLHDIAVQVGRTGKLTPVAMLEPVDVDGVTVSRASLHNIEEIEKKDVRPGDLVRIQRAGDVIPEVVERIEEEDEDRNSPFEMPPRCPICSTEVVREGPLHYCPNGLSCSAQLKGHIEHYAAREAMDIDGLGEKTVEQMVENKAVETIADLYKLSKNDLVKLEGFAQKSAQNLHEAIRESREVKLDRFLFALGIRHVGQHVATLVARAFPDLDAISRASEEQLLDIDGIGPEIARSIVEFFDQPENKQVIKSLLEAGLDLEPIYTEDENELPLEGMRFVFTGALENFTRSEAQNEVEDRGARATSSVSGATDYLVVGENPGSKLDEARDRGVTILDEEEFVDFLEENG